MFRVGYCETTSYTLDDLLTQMHNVITVTAKISQDSKISATDKKNTPFFVTLKLLNDNAEKLMAGEKTLNENFFEIMDDTKCSIEELKSAYNLSGISNPKINDAIDKITGIFELIEDNYSKSVVRTKKGGDLTDNEKTIYKSLIDRNNLLVDKLNTLEGKLKDNQAMTAEIQKALNKTKEIQGKSNKNSLNDFLSSLSIAASISAQLRYWDYYYRFYYPQYIIYFVDFGPYYIWDQDIYLLYDSWNFTSSDYIYFEDLTITSDINYDTYWDPAWGNMDVYDNYIDGVANQGLVDDYENAIQGLENPNVNSNNILDDQTTTVEPDNTPQNGDNDTNVNDTTNDNQDNQNDNNDNSGSYDDNSNDSGGSDSGSDDD